MLNVQRALQSMSVDELCEKYGLKAKFHPTDPLVILNYDQINCSSKTDPIVMECRGLTLEVGTWKVVAKAFDRFFNLGEALEVTGDFDWSDFSSYTKEDGSLILLYFYNGSWRVNTRGSFAYGQVNDSDYSWESLFWESFANSRTFEMDHPYTTGALAKGYTHVFELCTPYNKVVRTHNKSHTKLLGIVDNRDFSEYCPKEVDTIAKGVGLLRPARHDHSSLKDVKEYLRKLELEDPTDEGVVLIDRNGLRMKCKNKKYLALHRMCDNGNLFAAKNLLPFILDGETDELFAYFPEAEPRVAEMENVIGKSFEYFCGTWELCKDIDDQKEFALMITKKRQDKFGAILFQAKKNGTIKTMDLAQKFAEADDMILKILFKNNKGISKEEAA